MDQTIQVGARINGLTTHNTYLVVATTKAIRGNNAFGVRNMGSTAKIHYWPNAEAFNLIPNPGKEDVLYQRTSKGISIGTYEGVYDMPWDQIGRLLDKLRAHGDFDVMSADDWQKYVTSIGYANQRTGDGLEAGYNPVAQELPKRIASSI